MTRHWHAVYTFPQKEKKVAALLTRKGIKNYLPLNKLVSENANIKKPTKEALFSSYVFVYITDAEMQTVKAIPGTINFLHWQSKPAVITWEEIEAIKQLTSGYHNIKLEKSMVNVEDTVRVIDEPFISFGENSASFKFQTLKLVLPSLGYIMVAERDKVAEEAVQKEFSMAAFLLPRKLNLFFSN